ncbi:MAG: anti-sigma factor family protein [Candidatus Methylomirabilales bacterium]
MASHRRYRHALSAYVDGELGVPEIRRLEVHLAGCDACRQEQRNLEKLQGLLRQGLRDPRPEVPPVLWPGVRVRIEGGRPHGIVTAWMRRIWEAGWERPRLSLAGAAFATFLILSAAYLFWEAPTGRAPGQIVSVEPGEGEVVVEAVEAEPGFRAMVFTTPGRGLKVIWVVARGET